MDAVKDFGAVGDGRTDDTEALQRALRAAAGSVLTIPYGTFMIDGSRPLRMPAHTVVQMTGATLQVIPNGLEKYAVFTIEEDGATIYGGQIKGDRKTHFDRKGEWGFGIQTRGQPGPRNVWIENVVVSDMWGDGFYVGGGSTITLNKVVAMNNRRQGLSVIACDGLTVMDSTFAFTGGTAPSDGIDIEPDKGCAVDDVTIKDCMLKNNAGAGIEVAPKRGVVRNLKITGCMFSGNGGKKIKVDDLPFYYKWLSDLGLYDISSYTRK